MESTIWNFDYPDLKFTRVIFIIFCLSLRLVSFSQQLGYAHPTPVGTYFEGISFIPNSTKVLAVAEKSCNILISEDAGSTWEITCEVVGPESIDGFDGLYFVDDKLGFLVANYEIYRTTNGGSDWEVVFDDVKCNLFDIEMNANGIGIAAVNGSKVLLSIDTGKTWQDTRYDISFSSVAVNAKNRLILGGWEGEFWVSDDTSKTWTQVANDGARHVEMEFLNENQGIYVSADNAGFTEDGGDTWFRTLFHDRSVVSLATDPSGKAVLCNGRNVYTSNDAGKNWVQTLDLLKDFDQGDYDVSYEIQSLTSKGDTILAAGRYGLLMRSFDFGMTWELLSNHLTTNDMFDVFQNEDQIIAVGHTEILTSKDGGLEWNRSESPDFYQVFVEQFTDGSLITVSRDGEVFTSAGFEEAWVEKSGFRGSPAPRVRYGKMFPDESIVMVGNNGLIMKTNDRGENWQQILGSFTTEEQDIVTFDFLDDQTWVCGGNQNRVWRTDDAGQNWSEIFIESSQKRKILAIKLLDSDNMIVYRTHGAYQTADGGQTYQEISKDFHEAVTFNEEGKGARHAFSQVHVTNDFGNTWELLTTEVASVFNYTRIFGEDIWLIGQDGLLWRGIDAFAVTSGGRTLLKEVNRTTIVPNPASNNFRIVNSSDLKMSEAKLVIYDMLGRVVAIKEVNNDNMEFDISSMIDGIYSVHLYAGNKVISSEKLMVKKPF